MNQLTMIKQYYPLSRGCIKLEVTGGRGPYMITAVNSVGVCLGSVKEIKRGRVLQAVFSSYEDACSVAEDLLRDLKMTLEEDKELKKLYPPLTIRLDDL